eukprot:1047435-Pelagomonas_calceolata.AAC.1
MIKVHYGTQWNAPMPIGGKDPLPVARHQAKHLATVCRGQGQPTSNLSVQRRLERVQMYRDAL